jgi:protein-glutamine gamma-glutamyltransferase
MAWLTVPLVLVAAPHALRLPAWIVLWLLVAALWRLVAARQGRRLPGRALRVSLILVGVVGIFAEYGTFVGPDAGVGLLVTMLAMKLLETRTLRDATVLMFLSYFLVMASFLYSQSIFMGLYMALAVLATTAGIIGLNHPQGRRAGRYHLRLAGTLLAQALPIAVLLFLLFPRLPGPLWGVPGEGARAVTGLSEEMAPGSISALSRSEALAFRVTFHGAVPAPEHLYWRGPVFSLFDGRTWSAAPLELIAEPSPAGMEDPVFYTVTLEPHNRRWVFALDMPSILPDGVELASDYHLVAERPLGRRQRYNLVSYLHYTMEPGLAPSARASALQLPAETNLRTRALGLSWRRDAASDAQIVQRALTMFREEPFVYTLTPPLLGETDPVDEFLFGTRRGFCEHYASAFTMLMRAAGIPARVVTGYQGADFNPVGGYHMVRQSDAHAWSEVWLAGRGWVRVDPTAAVSPARLEYGIAGALPLAERSPLATRWVQPARLAWDALHHGWQQWVLGYGPERQRGLLAALGLRQISWAGLAGLMMGSGGLLLALLAASMLRRPRSDPVQALYRRFCARLARRGLARRGYEGPLAFATRIAHTRPDLAGDVARITDSYVALRYGPGPAPRALETLRRLVRRFKP